MPKLIDLFVRETGLAESDIRKIIATAPRRYKTYAIKKRNGIDRRIISQPAKELKILQRILIDKVLLDLPVHASATAYRRGTSIRANVRPHLQAGPILKFDFVNFFPSLKESDWEAYCEKNGIFDNSEDINISCKILFKYEPSFIGLRLSIGAPSSPILSNILMYDIDRKIEAEIVNHKVRYTRYADDMTFSAPRTGFLVDVQKMLNSILTETKSPRLRLNSSKTVYATKRVRRQVTGLIITNDGQISVGRERKRNLFAAVHAALAGKLNPDQIAETIGLISYVRSVEDDFLSRLRRKYGPSVMDKLYALHRVDE